ncbi:MAG: hypothetical protein WCE62_13135 [Polyangiales bacterium]
MSRIRLTTTAAAFLVAVAALGAIAPVAGSADASGAHSRAILKKAIL